ncbi:sigma-70 family RNA polymerase sigma factor [Simiduia curdlanivorans]|uniref:RNA polymerase sigma factor n=1 Tax=Simiduia curdlanivorans TaxID=1492769 RepID=A0ABV8V553_9GAMM|nr:sigma-70 family RNA polymerase sigma factor [Simiduia curdlanivorans]MDN3640753.1 sigma-70 family RNA polymerase sigma factor [Simiduia curdlanivorans]
MDNEELVNLLARCALRDQKALALLYQKTAAYLNAVAYRMLGSSDASNDVLQEAFVQIWDNATSYMPSQAKPLTWMSSIVRYRAIDKIRHERRHQNRPPAEEEANILLTTPDTDTQEDIHQRFRLNEQLQKCFEVMNENFKRSVQLAYLQGYSREEIAETLGANVNTVKSWLRRGAANLKACLEGTHGGKTQ